MKKVFIKLLFLISSIISIKPSDGIRCSDKGGKLVLDKWGYRHCICPSGQEVPYDRVCPELEERIRT